MSTEATMERPAENKLVPVRKSAPIVITPASPAASNSEGMDLGPILHSARRRWQISLLLGLVLCGLAVVAAWTLAQPGFTAAAHLRISASNPRLVFDTAEGTTTFEIEKSTQQQLMLAPFVLSKALGQEGVSKLAVVQEEEDPVSWLQEHLNATYLGDGEIMMVSLELEDPNAAVTIVNAVVDTYLEEVVGEERQQRSDRLKSLEAAYAEAYEKVRDQREDLKAFAREFGMSDSETMTLAQQSRVQEFAFLHNVLSQVEWDLMQAENEVEAFISVHDLQLADDPQNSPVSKGEGDAEQANNTTPDGDETANEQLANSATLSDEELEMIVTADSEAKTLQEDIDRLEDKMSVRAERMAPDLAARLNQSDRAALAEVEEKLQKRKRTLRTLVLERMQQQLDERRQMVSRNATSNPLLWNDPALIQKELKTKQQQVQMLRGSRDALKDKVAALEKERRDLGGSSLEIEMDRSELADAEEVRRTVGAEIERTKIELKSTPRVKLLNKAGNASPPDNRKRYAITGAAGVCGLLAPLFLITLYDFRKRHVNDAQSVIASLDTAHLGSIPRVPTRLLNRRRSAKNRRYQQWQERLLESVDAIASLLIRNARLESNRVIQITSPAAGEGKSTVATQLARSLARSGHRTLLVDFDLRRPTLHSAFGFNLQPGVAEVLEQSAPLEKTIVKTSHPQMDLLTAGCRQEKIFAGSSAGLLESLFKTLREDYEFVIVDSCPILPVVDSRVVGQYVDGVILSLVKDFSKLPQAVKAREIMTSYGIRVIGTVVTGCQEDDYYSDNRKYLT